MCAKRGRPKKVKDGEAPAPEAEAPEGGDAEEEAGGDTRPRRGRKSRREKAQEEARDLLESQQVDLEVLEEFKARAAAEEEARQAVMAAAGEDDPRRLSYHRSLLVASQRGLVDECARIVSSMADAGLTPGPRAVHVWAYAYIQIGDGPSARRVAQEAREVFGVEWIPETYVALMHGALNATRGGPDLVGALEVWVAQQDAGAQPQLGFTFLAKELFRLRFSALAMQVVSEGYAAGLQPDQKLAALVIEQLCKQGLLDEARAEMGRLLAAGLPVGPEHYDTLLRLEAARGNLQTAREMLQSYYTDPRFAPPRAATYTSLIRGIVSSLTLPPLAGPGAAPAPAAPPPDSLGPESGLQGGVLGAGGGPVLLDAEGVDRLVVGLREEMLSRGLRPARETYAAMVEAYAAVGDLDSALTAYETLSRARGSPALMRKKYLGRLVVSLLLADRPVHALRLLADCAATPAYADATSCVGLPPSAATPLPGPPAAGGGRTALTAWLPRHAGVMRERRGQRASMAAFMRDADLSSRREYDGVVLGLGGCVVTEDGVFVPPGKMSLAEMRAELGAAGGDAEVLANTGRKELSRMIKDRRSRLPDSVLDLEAQLQSLLEERAARAEAEAAGLGEDEDEEGGFEEEEEEYREHDPDEELDENVAAIIANEDTFDGGESVEESAMLRAAARGKLVMPAADRRRRGGAEVEEDDVEDDLPLPVPDDEEEEEEPEDMAAAFGDDADGDGEADGAAGGRRRRRRGGEDDDDDDGDLDDSELGALGLGEEDGGAPPLSDGLSGSTPLDPASLEREIRMAAPEDEEEAVMEAVLAMSSMDAGRYNPTAGISIAMRLLSVWGAVGLQPSPADLLTLYEGAALEEAPRAAAELAEMLPGLGRAGQVSEEQLGEMMVTLANVCLRPEGPDAEAADRVVTAMEDCGLQVPADVYAGLEVALGGRARLRESIVGAGPVDALGFAGPEDEDGEPVLPLGELGAGGEAEEGEGEGEAAGEGEAEEGEAEAGEAEEGEAEAFGEYEEDAGQSELEAEEMGRLFVRDTEDDDAWLDDLDEPTADVAEVRAAAAAEAAAAAQQEAIAATLAAVRVRNPAAAKLLEARIQEAIAEQQEAAAALPDPDADADAAKAAGAEVEVVAKGEDEALEAAEQQGLEAAFGAPGGGLDLAEMAADAQWEATAVGEMPPAAIAEAAEAALERLRAEGELSAEDEELLRRVAVKAQILADLAAASDAAAAAYPGGVEAAEAARAATLTRLHRAEAEAVEAALLMSGAFATSGTSLLEAFGPLLEEEAAARRELGEGEEGEDGDLDGPGEGEEEDGDAAEGEDGEEDELAAAAERELEEEAGEYEANWLLREEDFDPAVDDSVLPPAEQVRLADALMAAGIWINEDAMKAGEAEQAEARRREGEGEGEGEEAGEEASFAARKVAEAEAEAANADEAWPLEHGLGDSEVAGKLLKRLLAAADAQPEDSLSEEQQLLYDMAEAGDLAALEAAVGPDALQFFLREMQAAKEAQGTDAFPELAKSLEAAFKPKAPKAAPAQPEDAAAADATSDAADTADDDDDTELVEVFPGKYMKPGFVRRFKAVLAERADALAAMDAAGEEVPEEARDPQIATLEVLLAMASGYRLEEEEFGSGVDAEAAAEYLMPPEGEEGEEAEEARELARILREQLGLGEEGEEGEAAGEGEGEGEEDDDLGALRRETAAAMAEAEAAVGGPREAEARARVQQAVTATLEALTEVYHRAEEEAEDEAAAAAEREENEEYEEYEEDEEDEEAYEGEEAEAEEQEEGWYEEEGEGEDGEGYAEEEGGEGEGEGEWVPLEPSVIPPELLDGRIVSPVAAAALLARIHAEREVEGPYSPVFVGEDDEEGRQQAMLEALSRWAPAEQEGAEAAEAGAEAEGGQQAGEAEAEQQQEEEAAEKPAEAEAKPRRVRKAARSKAAAPEPEPEAEAEAEQPQPQEEEEAPPPPPPASSKGRSRRKKSSE